MGIFMGKAMDENMKKNQVFMVENQKTMMERQMQMQNYMREQQMSMGLAKARDMFYWWSAFYAVALVGGIAGFRRTRKPSALVPLMPLTFIWAYQYDLAMGNKMERMRNDAEKILREENALLDLPTGMPTMQLLDERRNQAKSS